MRESYLDIDGGTWVVEQDNGDRRGLYIGTVDRTIPAGEANARLIAAAPELLEALEECLARMDELQKHTNYPLAWPRVKGRAAIAAAKGEQCK